MSASSESSAAGGVEGVAVDEVTARIAEYAVGYNSPSDEALATVQLSLLDAVGCGLLALRFPECTKLLGPMVPGTITPYGARTGLLLHARSGDGGVQHRRDESLA